MTNLNRQVIMMSLAEGYYVPLYSFSMEPEAYDQKVRNLEMSFLGVECQMTFGTKRRH